MTWVAWKMLTGDRAKYLGTVFGVAFGVLLVSQQTSIFVSIMKRTAAQILDLREASLWVMDKRVQSIDEVRPLSDGDLYNIRSVTGVDWAVRYFKGQVRARVDGGNYRQAFLMGLDDHTLVGAPNQMLMGSLDDLERPDAVIIDSAGYSYLWPNEPMELGRTLEMNDRRAVLVGICKATPPFMTFPLIYTRYSRALHYIPGERNQMTFVLAQPVPGLTTAKLKQRIEAQTGLKALTRDGFLWLTVEYYLKNTGIPINFGITIALGFIVGTAIAGQTFYLFTLENLKQFGALKAMGVTNGRLIGMVLLQATLVGLIGYGLGIGATALFFEVTKNVVALQGFFMPVQVAIGTAVAVGLIVLLASLLSLRKVLVLEPAVVFR
jgi:putative ABC transport system permease protein